MKAIAAALVLTLGVGVWGNVATAQRVLSMPTATLPEPPIVPLHPPGVTVLRVRPAGEAATLQAGLDSAMKAAPSVASVQFGGEYTAWYRYISCSRPPAPYFQCDYTTKTCFRGMKNGAFFAGVVLGEDRQTVLAHIGSDLTGGIILNFDTGLATNRAGQRLPAYDLHPREPWTRGLAFAARDAPPASCPVQPPE